MIQTADACCILRLSFIGYRTLYVNVKGSDVGVIQMEEDQPMLSEIIVKGQMPKTKLTGNSMITTIQTGQGHWCRTGRASANVEIHHSSHNHAEYPSYLEVFAIIRIFAVETVRLGCASAIQASLIAFDLHEPCIV